MTVYAVSDQCCVRDVPWGAGQGARGTLSRLCNLEATLRSLQGAVDTFHQDRLPEEGGAWGPRARPWLQEPAVMLGSAFPAGFRMPGGRGASFPARGRTLRRASRTSPHTIAQTLPNARALPLKPKEPRTRTSGCACGHCRGAFRLRAAGGRRELPSRRGHLPSWDTLAG